MFKAYFKKWRKKSLFTKFMDIIFLLLIITLLIPQGRMAVGGFVNGLKAKISQPGLVENMITVRENAYEWTMKDINNNPVDLSAHKGKVIFLNLWATWCPPCVGEMPSIQTLYDKFKDNPDIVFLMVSNEDVATIKKFVDRKSYSFPVYSSIGQTPPDFSSRSIPTTYVINKKGEIVIKEIGAMNWGGKKMTGLVEDLLVE